MSPRPQIDGSIAEQAARWATVIEHGGQKEHVAFAAWLRASPHHVREYLLITALDKELDGLDLEDLNIDELLAKSAINVTPLDNGIRDDSAPTAESTVSSGLQLRARRLSVRWLTGLAACVASVTIAAWWYVLRPAASQDYSTGIAEERSFSLPDGSIVQLSPVSRIEVRFSPAVREVSLLQGEAVFKVQHNALRAFRVHAGGALIEDVGTEFHVYRRPTGTVVSVLEGAVEISPESKLSGSAYSVVEPSARGESIADGKPPAKPTSLRARLAAGEEARIAVDGHILKRTPISVEEMSSWRRPHLIFSGDTLSEIAEDFNRYNREPQIRIEGDALRTKRFSGSFDAHDPQSLVDYLQQNVPITVERAGNELVIRSRE